MAMNFIEEFLLIIVFGSTMVMLALHPLEWFEIRSYRKTARDGLNVNGGLGFLKRGLDVESYYYLLVLGFLLIFYREPFILALVLGMIVAHVDAKRDISSSVLRDRKHLAGMLVFDVVELVFLVFLISALWSMI
jgi:hypothetical protein